MPSVGTGTGNGQPSVMTIGQQLAAPPVVAAVRLGKYLEIRCPFCGRRHTHGLHTVTCGGCDCRLHENWKRPWPCTCPTGSGDGPRTSHCTTRGAPSRGYYVREVAA